MNYATVELVKVAGQKSELWTLVYNHVWFERL